jgi:hypothetical protein
VTNERNMVKDIEDVAQPQEEEKEGSYGPKTRITLKFVVHISSFSFSFSFTLQILLFLFLLGAGLEAKPLVLESVLLTERRNKCALVVRERKKRLATGLQVSQMKTETE